MPRTSTHNPITKSYAIDQIEDIEHLRAVAHRMWEAFYACHSQAAHVYARECTRCNDYVDGYSEQPCDRYVEWQKAITAGFRSV